MQQTRRRTKQESNHQTNGKYKKQEESNQKRKTKSAKGESKNKKEKEVATCLNCGKIIFFETDKYVLVGTYNKKEVMEEKYFHFQCWVEYFKDRVQNKVMSLYNNVMGNFLGAVKEAKEKGVLHIE